MCQPDVLGIFEDPTDCTRFCVCAGTTVTRGTCPDGQHFSVSERQCVMAADADCEPDGTLTMSAELSVCAAVTVIDSYVCVLQ